MHIEKAKLPQGMSYPLKSSVLQQALDDAGITTDVILKHNKTGVFFEAFFWPPSVNAQHERFYIRATAVPASKASAAREQMERVVIPDFIAWAKKILSSSEDSETRRSEQYFRRDDATPAP